MKYQTMKNTFILLLAAGSFSYSCSSLSEKLTSAREEAGSVDSAIIYGPNADAQNDFSALASELNADAANCSEKEISPTNYLLCSPGSVEQIDDIVKLSAAIEAGECRAYSITDGEKLNTLLGSLGKARSLERDLKYKDALSALNEVTVAGHPYYERYSAKLSELAKKPEKDLKMVLSALESAEKTTLSDDELSSLAANALASDPELANNEELRKRTAAIAQKINGEYTCSAIVSEPPGDAFISTGYDLPLSFNGRCTPTHGIEHLAIQATANAAVRFGVDHAKEYNVTFKESQGELPVSELSATQSENVISLSGRGKFAKTYAALQPLGSELNPRYSLSSESSYTLQKVPVHYSRDYAARMAGANKPKVWDTLQGEKSVSTLGENGQLTMGGSKNGEPFDMMFGHPNGKYAEGIWSSYNSVKIDEKVYQLNKSGVEQIKREKSADGKTLTIVHSIPDEKVQITQAVTLQTIGQQDRFLVSYTFKNNDTKARKIGLRMLLDTWAGKTDGVPFVTPGNTSGKNVIHLTEFKFNASYSSIWETIDTEGDGHVYLRNVMTGPGLVAPDNVAFVRWGPAYRSEWKYDVNEELSVTGDSAVIMWWEPVSVEAGSERNVATSFGSFQRNDAITFDLQDPETGFGYLYVAKTNTTGKDQVYTLKAESTDASVTGDNELRVNVPAGGSVYRAIPLTVAGGSASSLKVTEKMGETVSEQTIGVPLSNKDGRSSNIPVWVNTKPYPVRYISTESGRSLSASIKNLQGQEIGRGELKEISSGTETVYGANIPVPADFDGEVIVEISE